jgi:hypothetical protein
MIELIRSIEKYRGLDGYRMIELIRSIEEIQGSLRFGGKVRRLRSR